ncbi:MAG TPA: methylated-DNA--[protein]-cysteine S-methyltransferase [Candidatus Kapabacteria bacterium]|jgi:methylated-DNA-[protein]-cysteine S-methyltransferase
MEIVYTERFESPIGQIVVSASEAGIQAVSFATNSILDPKPSALTSIAIRQLENYFTGNLQEFKLPLSPEGTVFDRFVWDELQKIPYGSTTSYAAVASAMSHSKAVRAVGRANGANPIAIVIPCHRVIGADGSLTGYAGELWRKRWLLDHEARVNGTILL